MTDDGEDGRRGKAEMFHLGDGAAEIEDLGEWPLDIGGAKCEQGGGSHGRRRYDVG